MKSSSILDHVPIEDTVHKENTIKPGPWNGNGSRRCPLMTSATKSAFKGKILVGQKPHIFLCIQLSIFCFIIV